MEPVASICYRIILNTDDDVAIDNILSNSFLFAKGEKASDIPNQFAAESGNKTMLMLAAKEGRYSCCKLLIGLDPRSIYAQNEQGLSALHYAAYHNRADVSFLLLEAGSNPNLKNGYNETPLDCALAGKHFKLARSLERSIYYNDEPGDNVANAKSARRELPEELEEGEVSEEDEEEAVHESTAKDASSDGANNTSVAAAEQAILYEACRMCLVIMAVDGEDADLSQLGVSFRCIPSSGAISSEVKVMIGRSSTATIQINDISISKTHAALVFKPRQGLMLSDLGSKHGTFVNNKKLQPLSTDRDDPDLLVALHPDMHVRFGRVKCVIRIEKTQAVLSAKPIASAKYEQQQREEKEKELLNSARESMRVNAEKSEQEKRNAIYIQSRQIHKNAQRVMPNSGGVEIVGNMGTSRNGANVNNVMQSKAGEDTEYGSNLAMGSGLLSKLGGWQKGDGLGKNGEGIKHALEVKQRDDRLGLGNASREEAEGGREKGGANKDPAKERIRQITTMRYYQDR